MLIPAALFLALAVAPGPAAAALQADRYDVVLRPGRGEAEVTFTPAGGGPGAGRLFVSGDDDHAWRIEPGNSYLFPESTWDRLAGNRSGPFMLTVTTRSDEAVWASGEPAGREPAGEAGATRWTFRGDTGDRGLGLYLVTRPAEADGSFPQGPEWARDLLARTLETLVGLFGPLPGREPRVVVVDFPRPLAKSLPGALFLDRRLAERNGPPPASRVAVLAHETAHLWWPNAVPAVGPGRGALHEGLADYAACRTVGDLLGQRAEESRWQALRDEYLASSEAMRVAGVSLIDPGRGGDYGRALRYARSSWVVRMLAARVGESAFTQALAAVRVGRHPFSWDGLVAAAAEASGSDLETFAAAWIAGSGHPWIEVAGDGPVRLRNAGPGDGEFPAALLCGEARRGPLRWLRLAPGESRPWSGAIPEGCGPAIDPEGRFLLGPPGPAAPAGLALGRAWGFPVVQGITVGSAAHAAGLRQGDLIVAVDGKPQDEEKVAELLERMSSGPALRLRVRRGTAELELPYTPPAP
jgi:hypothetical protein